jgi:hypothetical protein
LMPERSGGQATEAPTPTLARHTSCDWPERLILLLNHRKKNGEECSAQVELAEAQARLFS